MEFLKGSSLESRPSGRVAKGYSGCLFITFAIHGLVLAPGVLCWWFCH